MLPLMLAQPTLAQVTDDTVTTFTLDNGMEAIVIEDHRAPVVVHMVWYDVGAADEPPGKSGIAHFLEHLMFKGTDTLEPGEFSRTVSAQGGSDNAFTSYDYTGYFQRVAADRLELMMRMEADRMRNLVLDDEDMLTERDVVLEERAQRTESNPGAIFGEMRSAAQYLNHPYRIPIIGWRHEVSELTLEDALAFYRRFYAPNNATLIVAGDVEPEEVRALAETHYGPIEPTPGLGPRVRPSEPPQVSPRRLTYEDARVSNPYVVRSYLAPERDTGNQEEAAALTLLAEIMGGSPATSVMGRILEQEEGVALYTQASYSGTSYDDTTFSLAVLPTPDRTLEQAEADLDRMIDTILEEGIDPAQLERMRTQIRAASIYERDSLQGRAREFGTAITSGLTVQDVLDWPEILAAVTEEDILAAARRVFRPERSVTGYLRKPEPAAPPTAARIEPVSQAPGTATLPEAPETPAAPADPEAPATEVPAPQITQPEETDQ
ncbi:M16 family metallopeptidase [Jannaschia marina]|uniref:M16 family metallopeptidase n=1 Tax=Jannaschia marina TaxID=2741674 RepID=UPI0015CA93BA|nr:pitrilysin family protein [Jannaschia marina]